jgi:integrase
MTDSIISMPMPASAPAADGHAAHRPRRKELTTVGIERLKPRSYRYEIGDGRAQGLRLLVSPSGHKSFIVRFRFAGKPKKYTVGPVTLGLKAARAEAAKVILAVAQGNDPTLAKRAVKAEQKRAVLAVEDTFHSVSERFLKLEGGKMRSADMVRKTLQRLVHDTLGARAIADIKRSEIVRLLDSIETERGPVAAESALAVIRRIMSWHAARSDDFRSPIVRGMSRVNIKARSRTRVLTDDEIQKIWKAAEDAGPFGRAVQLLLLSGARRTEVTHLRWNELSGSDWLLPPERNKTKIPLLRPLSGAALEVIAKTPRTSDTYVFCADGVHPFSGYTRPKEKLDAASGVTGWRLQDLRRTARSLMSRATVRAEDAEACLGHALPGIQATYNKHDFYLEKKRAFELLAAEVERIINPPPEGKVIHMKRG